MSFALLPHQLRVSTHLQGSRTELPNVGTACRRTDELNMLSIQKEYRDAIFSQRSTTMLTLLATHARTPPRPHRHPTQDAITVCPRVYPDSEKKMRCGRQILDIQHTINVVGQFVVYVIACLNTSRQRKHFLESIFVKGKVMTIGFLSILLFIVSKLFGFLPAFLT